MNEDDELRIPSHCYNDRDALASVLADTVADRLNAALGQRERVSLVVSGGNTPIPFFEALRTRDLAWDRITVTLADERWVGTDHEASNEALVRTHLLQDKAAKASFVSLVNDADDPISGELRVHEALAAVSRPFDVVILGSGGDGHTASLFPHAEELPAALDRSQPALCRGIYGSKEPRARLTLTRRALLESRWIAIHVTGTDKWDALVKADAGHDERAMPIRTILHQHEVPVDVYWAP